MLNVKTNVMIEKFCEMVFVFKFEKMFIKLCESFCTNILQSEAQIQTKFILMSTNLNPNSS